MRVKGLVQEHNTMSSPYSDTQLCKFLISVFNGMENHKLEFFLRTMREG